MPENQELTTEQVDRLFQEREQASSLSAAFSAWYWTERARSASGLHRTGAVTRHDYETLNTPLPNRES
jgi:hypothetical protein